MLAYVHNRWTIWQGVICAFTACSRMGRVYFGKEKMDLKGINNNEGLLKKSFGISKIKEGLTVNDLESAKDERKIEKRCGSHEVDEMMIKNKQVKELQKLKLQTGKTFQNGDVKRDVPAITLPSLVYENVKLAYMTRSLVQKLLEQPESFEDKVKGAFVCVELPPNDVNRKKSFRLVQVTGVTKTSTEKDNMDVKLQALDIPTDISINMLSNAYLSEEQCEHMRHQLRVGLLKTPTIEELQQKVVSLHEDIIDDNISRELRRLQAKMDHSIEKGRKQEYLDLAKKKDQLDSSSARKQLLNNLLKVIADVQTFSEEILNEKQGKQGSPELIPNKDRSSTLTDIVVDGKNQNEGSLTSIPIKMGFKGNITTSAEEQVGEQTKDVRTRVSLTRKTEENPGRSFLQILQDIVVEEVTEKSMAVGPSANLPSEKRPLMCMPPPQQGGVVTPAHLSTTVMQQSNQQLHSSGALDINSPIEFDDITIKLVKDAALLNDKVWGEQYTDEELLKFSNQYDAKMFLVRREIMHRFEKILNDQRSFDAKRQKLDMNLVEANHKLSIAEDELKKLKVKMEQDAQLSASKIRMMEEDAWSSETRIRKMEKDAELCAVKIRKMEEDAQISATKIRKMEEDAQLNVIKSTKMEEETQLSAVKIRNMEEDAELTAAKIRKMEEDAGLNAIKITKMEEDARLSEAKKIKMEKDSLLTSTTIRTLKRKIVGLYDYQRKQLEEVKILSAMEALSCYRRSSMFLEEVFGLLSPIYNAGWTDCLQEIKGKHLPHLNLRQFPRFDFNSWEKADLIYYTFTNLPVQLEQVAQLSNCVGIRPGDASASTSGV